MRLNKWVYSPQERYLCRDWSGFYVVSVWGSNYVSIENRISGCALIAESNSTLGHPATQAREAAIHTLLEMERPR